MNPDELRKILDCGWSRGKDDERVKRALDYLSPFSQEEVLAVLDDLSSYFFERFREEGKKHRLGHNSDDQEETLSAWEACNDLKSMFSA